jgi:hypothetical protein
MLLPNADEEVTGEIEEDKAPDDFERNDEDIGPDWLRDQLRVPDPSYYNEYGLSGDVVSNGNRRQPPASRVAIHAQTEYNVRHYANNVEDDDDRAAVAPRPWSNVFRSEMTRMCAHDDVGRDHDVMLTSRSFCGILADSFKSGGTTLVEKQMQRISRMTLRSDSAHLGSDLEVLELDSKERRCDRPDRQRILMFTIPVPVVDLGTCPMWVIGFCEGCPGIVLDIAFDTDPDWSMHSHFFQGSTVWLGQTVRSHMILKSIDLSDYVKYEWRSYWYLRCWMDIIVDNNPCPLFAKYLTKMGFFDRTKMCSDQCSCCVVLREHTRTKELYSDIYKRISGMRTYVDLLWTDIFYQ